MQKYPMDDSIVVKVTVNEKQTRITIPKGLAVKSFFITTEGKPGKHTHAIIRSGEGKSLIITPVQMLIP